MLCVGMEGSLSVKATNDFRPRVSYGLLRGLAHAVPFSIVIWVALALVMTR